MDVYAIVETIVYPFFGLDFVGTKAAKMVSDVPVTGDMPTVNFSFIGASRILVNQVLEALQEDISKADIKEIGIGFGIAIAQNREPEQIVPAIA